MYLVFRFLTGFCSAAFLSVAGGSVADLFDNTQIGLYVALPQLSRENAHVLFFSSPMAFYTISPFIGPVLGPLISGFINQVRDWILVYAAEETQVEFRTLIGDGPSVFLSSGHLLR